MSKMIQGQIPKLKMLFLGAGLILFTQAVKLIKNPGSTPVTLNTLLGLLVLVFFAFIGLLLTELMKMTKIKVLADFPVLGWVSITSLIFCLLSDFFIHMIAAVDFLAITTPVLAFAGVSVADNLGQLSKNSWKYLIVAAFVFLGSYLGRTLLAQVGIFFSNQ